MQNYQNHVKKYYPQAVYFLISILLLGFSIIQAIRAESSEKSWIWIGIGSVAFLLIWQSAMTRIHYALNLQNRIILGEINFRFFRLTGKDLEKEYPKLTDAQLFALRFASDDELLKIIEKARQENLSPDSIKKQFKPGMEITEGFKHPSVPNNYVLCFPKS